ncbi:MAG: HesA/MoeB/ThiF family protein [Bdellovibrionales bacterium]|nr:HesA/MoeB/ThiF family protein [Massilia sp.]
MTATATYHFNPFSLVTRVNDEIMINTFPSNRVIFSASHQPIVDYMIDKGELEESDVLKFIAPSRLQELVHRKVLLKGAPQPIAGRYSRQLGYFSMISEQPAELQRKVQGSHALILGVGAIGSHTCWNLAAIGVGKITLVDFDTVEESNFNRQLMYGPEDLGKFKVDVLGDKIRAFNPQIEVVSINKKITSLDEVVELVRGVDIVLKAIDTPEESMDWVNTACANAKVPYICGGFLDSTAVVGPNFMPGKTTCSACQGATGSVVRRLHGTGPTFGPLATLVTSMLSMIAFKILIGKADGFANRIYMYNADNGTWDNELVLPNRDCAVCGSTKPVAANDEEPHKSAVLSFRALFVAMLTLTVILGEFYTQPLVGVMAFFGMFASIPVINKIYGGNALRARREFFVLACIYIGFSLIGLLVRTLYSETFAWPHTLREAFTTIQVVDGHIVQAALSVAIMFFALCTVTEVVPRIMKFLNQEL